MSSLQAVIVGGSGKVSRLLTTLLTSSIPAHRVKSIIRSDSQTSAIKLLAPNPDLDLVTPIVLSLEKSPVSEFTQVFEGADVVFFVAGAGGKAGENGEAADERTKTVDYEGAVKVFDAVEKVQGGGKNVKKPRLILVSYMDIHRDNAIPSYYNDEDRKVAKEMREAIPHYMRWKYEADKELVKRKDKFEWTILRPGVLSDEPGTGRAAIGSRQAHLGQKVSRDDVAKVLALLATRPQAARLAIDVAGGEDDIEQALDAFVKEGISDFS